MGVKFLNQNITVNSTRPAGFKFPVGLTQTVVGIPDGPTSVDYLVVAGGGGGGNVYGGGGGAGGFLTGSGHSVTVSTSYEITVGAGGPAQTNGSSSIFDTFTSVGGGRGGNGNPDNGANGGSGGGGETTNALGTPGQGSNGGSGHVGTNFGRGGGGGAGGVGTNGISTTGGNGGPGIPSPLSGTPVTYAGGGGGGTYQWWYCWYRFCTRRQCRSSWRKQQRKCGS
jgi:hypothetical protein